MPTDIMEAILALASAHAIITKSLEAGGLSFAELRLLLSLREASAGRRPTEIAQELSLSPSGVTRALLPLEKRGIVERKQDPRDGRASHVFLTPAGKELLDEAVASAGERGTKLLRRLSVGQTKQLQRLLEEIGR
jgi:DNA-binding MarR family transcriptional regulator